MAEQNLGLIDCVFPYLNTPYETKNTDIIKFIEDANKYLNNDKIIKDSKPFPGSIMSLVFKKF